MFSATAIVVNRSKQGALVFAKDFSEKIEKFFEKCAIFDTYPISANILDGYDLCITIGGDGTLLGIAPVLASKNIPVIGINYGSLGFLSSADVQSALDCIKKIQVGQFHTSERRLLKTVIGGNEVIALNEFVVRNIDCARAMKLQLELNSAVVSQYAADGLIIASTTGSTAYNMSAGGPIMHPSVDVLLTTPICPHSGPKNTIIFPIDSKIVIHGKSGEFAIYADSNHFGNAENIAITSTEYTLKIIQLLEGSFFHALNKRLKF